MSDIVERLQDHHDKLAAYPMLDAVADDCLSAAAEITRLRKIQIDPLIDAAKRMRDAYVATRQMESNSKTCPTIDEFDKLLAEYER